MAKGKNTATLVGSWSFLVGVILALLLGLSFTGPYGTYMLWLVFVLGIIVGLLNVGHSEAHAFLIAGTCLTLVSYLGATVMTKVVETGLYGVSALVGVLSGILTLVVPATIIVALRAVFVLARR